MFYNQLHNLQ